MATKPVILRWDTTTVVRIVTTPSHDVVSVPPALQDTNVLAVVQNANSVLIPL